MIVIYDIVTAANILNPQYKVPRFYVGDTDQTGIFRNIVTSKTFTGDKAIVRYSNKVLNTLDSIKWIESYKDKTPGLAEYTAGWHHIRNIKAKGPVQTGKGLTIWVNFNLNKTKDLTALQLGKSGTAKRPYLIKYLDTVQNELFELIQMTSAEYTQIHNINALLYDMRNIEYQVLDIVDK